jgi:3-hydroxybutyryl-CoA dehydrogenase
MPLVEVVRAPQTDADSIARAVALMQRWGKTAVITGDAPGFIVNRVNRPFTIEALRMLETGVAGIADIDDAIRAAGYPMGPFELMDLIGIDVNLAVATAVYEGLGHPDRLRPSPIQERLVADGRLGRKTGTGFYAYTGERRGDPASDLAVTGVGSSSEIVAQIERGVSREAELALRDGVATADSIDLALKLGAGHPRGPFESNRAHG